MIDQINIREEDFMSDAISSLLKISTLSNKCNAVSVALTACKPLTLVCCDIQKTEISSWV